MCTRRFRSGSTYTKTPIDRQNQPPGWVITTHDPSIKLGGRDRTFLTHEGEKLGLGVKYNCDEAPEGLLFVTDHGPTKHHRGPFDERLAHLMSHIVHGGEHREDTALAGLTLAAFATT